MLVQYCHPEGEVCETRNINMFIGAYTTAHASLELCDLKDWWEIRLLRQRPMIESWFLQLKSCTLC